MATQIIALVIMLLLIPAVILYRFIGIDGVGDIALNYLLPIILVGSMVWIAFRLMRK
jgi:hypothetical protein